MNVNYSHLSNSSLRPVDSAPGNRLSETLSHQGGSLWLVLWERRLIVIAALLISVVLAVVYLIQSTAIYSSESQIYVEQKAPRVIADDEGLMTQSKNYLNTQCELLHSPAILSSVLDDLDPGSVHLFDQLPDRNSMIKTLHDSTHVTVDSKSDIIHVSVRSPWPDEATLLTNKIVEAYIRYHSQEKKSQSQDMIEILKREKETLEQQRQANSEAILAFTRTHGSIAIDSRDGRVIDVRFERLSEALTAAELDTLQARADYESLNAIMDDPSRIQELVDSHKASGQYGNFDASETRLHNELNDLHGRLEVLSQESTASHPAVQAIWERIAQIERELESIQHRYAQACRNAAINKWVAAMRREEQIRSEWRKQQDLAVQNDAQAEEYALLQGERDRIYKAGDTIDSRIKELNMSDDTGGLNIKILQRGQVPSVAFWPNKRKVVSNAMLVGLFLGVLLALLLDWLDHRVRDAGEVAALLGISVLGSVPAVSSKQKIGYNENVLTRHGTLVHQNPGSRIAEAFRSIRAALFYGLGLGASGNKWPGRTILVTSADPGDGKSTVVSNLAISLAQTGQKVLVIDADLRKPDQFRIFNIFRDKDLGSVLTGRCQAVDAIMSGVLDQVDLLPACAMPEWPKESQSAKPGFPPGPAELLSSPAFALMLEELSACYDCILIDSPPMLPCRRRPDSVIVMRSYPAGGAERQDNPARHSAIPGWITQCGRRYCGRDCQRDRRPPQAVRLFSLLQLLRIIPAGISSTAPF